MRTFGLLLLIAGVALFLYTSDRLGSVEPLPEGEGLDVGESLEHPAGKLQAGRYAGVGLALFGLLLLLFPKGRSV